MLSNEIRSYQSVQKWIANVDRMYHLSDEEWEQRLKILAEFCEEVGKNPDEIIAEALEDKTQKVDFMRQVRRMSKQVSSNSKAAHDWQNVIRSFFIHNGARVVVRPYPET